MFALKEMDRDYLFKVLNGSITYFIGAISEATGIGSNQSWYGSEQKTIEFRLISKVRDGNNW